MGSVIPALSTLQYTGSDPGDAHPLIDWNFVTTPQEGANGREMRYARGKTLGGSSARNYHVYQRCVPNGAPYTRASRVFCPCRY